jgi:hypothetical protein
MSRTRVGSIDTAPALTIDVLMSRSVMGVHLNIASLGKVNSWARRMSEPNANGCTVLNTLRIVRQVGRQVVFECARARESKGSTAIGRVTFCAGTRPPWSFGSRSKLVREPFRESLHHRRGELVRLCDGPARLIP